MAGLTVAAATAIGGCGPAAHRDSNIHKMAGLHVLGSPAFLFQSPFHIC